MHLLIVNAAALAVTLLYAGWRSHQRSEQKRQRLLRERVAYMLWAAAERA
jgi:hypothetical protein